MARNWNVGSLLAGFGQGYDIFGQVVRDRDLRKVAEEQPSETMGTPIEGDQAAVQQQLDAGAGMGEARRLAAAGVTPSSYSFMGQKQDAPFTPDQVSAQRRLAQAGVLEKHGDFDAGGRLRSQVAVEGEAKTRSARDTMRFAWEQEDRQRLQQERQREDDYKRDLDGLFQTSNFGLKMSAYSKQMADYQAAKSKYDERIAAGDSTAVAPPQPTPPRLSMSESLLDAAHVLNAKAKYGKASADDMMVFAQKMQSAMEEGLLKAMRLAQPAPGQKAGAPLTQVLAALNASGDIKVDPNAVVSDMPVDRGNGIWSRIITFKTPDGATQTLDTYAALQQFGKAGELFNDAMQLQAGKRADKQLAIAGAQLGIAQQQNARAAAADARAAEDHAAGIKERQLRGTVAGLQLEQLGDDPAKAAAAKAKLDAVGKGLGAVDKDQPAEVKLANAFVRAGLAPDMKSALQLATSKKGDSPDEIHKEIVQAGMKNYLTPAHAVAQADEAMVSMGYTKKGSRWAAVEDAAAKPATEADAHSQARAAVAQGADKEAVNKRLKDLGFKPL